MAEEFLRYEESSLHYVIEGTGSKILLVFHGFGQTLKLSINFPLRSPASTRSIFLISIFTVKAIGAMAKIR